MPFFRFSEKLCCLNWSEFNQQHQLSDNKNWFWLTVVWKSIGRTSIAEIFIKSGDKFLSWRVEQIFRRRFSTTSKFIIAPSDISASYSAKIYWFVITASILRRFNSTVTFATSQLVYLGAYVCWCICSTKSTFRQSFTLKPLIKHFCFFMLEKIKYHSNLATSSGFAAPDRKIVI